MMGFIDEQRQKYKLSSGKTSFLNYIFFCTIMIRGAAFSYKIVVFYSVFHAAQNDLPILSTPIIPGILVTDFFPNSKTIQYWISDLCGLKILRL